MGQSAACKKTKQQQQQKTISYSKHSKRFSREQSVSTDNVFFYSKLYT